MNSVPGIKKYYIGFGVLLVLMAGCLIYVVSQAGATKTDRQTNDAVEKISSKLDTSISAAGDIPASLQAAGLNGLPSTIQYTRLNSSSYKICVDYKTGSSGFDAGWTSLILGGALNSSYQPSSNSSHSYFDSSVEFNHKKGQNCQTVTPYIYNDYPGSFGGSPQITADACVSPAQDLVISGDLTVSRVDTATRTIYFDATNQYLYNQNNANETVRTISSKLYSDSTIFCDSKTLKHTDVSAVKAGDQVTVYLKNADDTTLSQVNTTYIFGN